MVEPVDATITCQPQFGLFDETVVIGSVCFLENLRGLAEFLRILVDKQTTCVTTRRAGVFKRVKFEMTRGAPVPVDGGCSVGVPGHKFERAAISKQARSAPFLRGHSI